MIATYLQEVKASVLNRWKYILLIWFSMLFLYLMMGGGIRNAPLSLLILTGFVFTFMTVSPGKYHDKVFISILLSGGLLSFYTPVMDIPDETAHYARSLYISDGNLYLPETIEDAKVADDVADVEEVFKEPLLSTDLEHEIVTEETVRYPALMHTNGYSFISYVPQSIGILIARFFRLSILSSIILGRFLNVLFYAVLARLAIKKSGAHRYVLGILSLMPMSIYISASFNQDGLSNGIIFLIIGLFCQYLEKEELTYWDLSQFAILSLLTATMKFPYILLIGLLLFLPVRKLSWKKYSFIAFLVLATTICALLWLKLASNINLSVVADANSINPIEKIKFTSQHFGEFSRELARELFYLVPNMLQMAFTFGWLTYSVDLVWLYITYLSCVFIMLPRKSSMILWNKIGLGLVAFGIVIGTLMTAFLMWNPVTALSFAGVQGRYLLGVFALLGLIVNLPQNMVSITSSETKIDNVVLFGAHFFILALVLRTIIEYYMNL